MSSLQGLPPLPRSLSGFNLNTTNREGNEPPPPPARSSSRPQRGGRNGPGGVRTPPQGRQLTTLDTQLAKLRREMVQMMDVLLLSFCCFFYSFFIKSITWESVKACLDKIVRYGIHIPNDRESRHAVEISETATPTASHSLRHDPPSPLLTNFNHALALHLRFFSLVSHSILAIYLFLSYSPSVRYLHRIKTCSRYYS